MDKKRERKLLLLLFLVSAFVAMYFLVMYWLVVALFSLMLFDGGNDIRTVFLVCMAMSMPFLIVIFQIVQVIAYTRKKRTLQIVSALFLLFSPLPLLFYN